MTSSISKPQFIIQGQSPSALKLHPSLGPAFLKRIPDDVIERGEEDGRPWLFLSHLPNLTVDEKAFFDMACSVSTAIENLFLMASGLAVKEASKPLRLRPNDKVFRRLKMLGHDFADPPESIADTITEMEAHYRSSIKKSNRRARQFEMPNAETIASAFPEEFFMIFTWITWGREGIGMGFFAKQTMIDVMQSIFPGTCSDDSERYYGERMRTRLKLKPFNPRKSVVIDSRTHHETGMISVTYREKRAGEAKSNQYLLQPIPPFYPSRYYSDNQR